MSSSVNYKLSIENLLERHFYTSNGSLQHNCILCILKLEYLVFMSKPNDLCKDNKATVILIKPGPLKSISLFAYENVLDLQRRMLPGVFPGGTLDFK